MTGGKVVTPETYIRHLPFTVIRQLCVMLDPGNVWEKFVVKIPKKIDVENFEPRYSQLNVKIFEEKTRRPDGSPTRSILDDWGTQNAKVKHLLKVLVGAELYFAADYLSVNVLHGDKIEVKPAMDPVNLQEVALPRPCAKNPCADTNVDDPAKDKHFSDKEINENAATCQLLYQRIRSPELQGPEVDVTSENRMSYESGCAPSKGVEAGPVSHPPSERMVHEPNKGRKPDENMDETLSQKIPYKLLSDATQQFSVDDITNGGRLIGVGGFGEVFLGYFPNGMKVAVKRLKECDGVQQQFETELSTLSTYRHENIVLLFGYSTDGPSRCIVYEFMPNGSLEDRLSCKDQSKPLNSELRVGIARGTAHGITYLNGKGLVHRDIKTANILLDDNFTPKVADFATVRSGPLGSGATLMHTNLVIGTSAYLAPEAIHFDISAKLDSYAFGVCLLELITGLPAMDQTREEKDLYSYVEENCDDILDMVDVSAGEWEETCIRRLYKVAQRCLEHKKKLRAVVKDILPELDELSQHQSDSDLIAVV